MEGIKREDIVVAKDITTTFLPQRKVKWKARPILDLEIGPGLWADQPEKDKRGSYARMIVFKNRSDCAKAWEPSFCEILQVDSRPTKQTAACTVDLAMMAAKPLHNGKTRMRGVFDKRYIGLVFVPLSGLNSLNIITHEANHLGFYCSNKYPCAWEKQSGTTFDLSDMGHRMRHATMGVQESVAYPTGYFASQMIHIAEKVFAFEEIESHFRVFEDNRKKFTKEINMAIAKNPLF